MKQSNYWEYLVIRLHENDHSMSVMEKRNCQTQTGIQIPSALVQRCWTYSSRSWCLEFLGRMRMIEKVVPLATPTLKRSDCLCALRTWHLGKPCTPSRTSMQRWVQQGGREGEAAHVVIVSLWHWRYSRILSLCSGHQYRWLAAQWCRSLQVINLSTRKQSFGEGGQNASTKTEECLYFFSNAVPCHCIIEQSPAYEDENQRVEGGRRDDPGRAEGFGISVDTVISRTNLSPR